jgi:restriction endonuclease S subunit
MAGKNWKMVSISSVANVMNGFAFKSEEYTDSGHRVIRITNVQKGEIVDDNPHFIDTKRLKEFARYELLKNDLLVSLTGNVGRVGILPASLEPALLNQRVGCIRPKSDQIDLKFLFYVLNSEKFERDCIANSNGIAQLNLSSRWIESYSIPLPPLEEQKRIAAILDSADAIRTKRKAAIAKLDEFAQSIFLDMFGDPVKNEKRWDVCKLKELTTKIGSGSTPTGGDASYKKEGISLIRSMNVYDGFFEYDSLAHIDCLQAKKLEGVTVEKDDVLLNITGASVCRCSLVPCDILPARVNQHVSIIRTISNLIDSFFLQSLLVSAHYKELLLKKARQNGATREALTKEQIENFDIICPPKKIQDIFCDRVKTSQALKDKLTQALSREEQLFSSLQQRAFSGEL